MCACDIFILIKIICGTGAVLFLNKGIYHINDVKTSEFENTDNSSIIKAKLLFFYYILSKKQKLIVI